MKDVLDFEALAAAVDALRELVNAMVAGLTRDGFTEEQARIIATGVFASIEGGKPDD